MVQEEPFDDDALHDQVERVDRDRAPAHVRIDNESPMLAERGGDRGAALACNSVDGERHEAASAQRYMLPAPAHRLDAADALIGDDAGQRTPNWECALNHV